MWGTEDRDHDADAEDGSDLAAHVHDRAAGGGAVRGEGAGGRGHDLGEGETDAGAPEDERGEDLGGVAGCESERGEHQCDARGKHKTAAALDHAKVRTRSSAGSITGTA